MRGVLRLQANDADSMSTGLTVAHQQGYCRGKEMSVIKIVVKAKCAHCTNMVLKGGAVYCKKMTSDKDKGKMRDITKHVKDALFAARCNKFIAKKGKKMAAVMIKA